MSRILAIDYGTKRCGLAITDPLKLIASPLETVKTSDIMPFINIFLKKENISALLIGLPKNLKGANNQLEKEITTFTKSFQMVYPDIEVVRIDERFTSKMAFSAMIDGGFKKKQRQDKAIIDRVSAALILQSYLDQNR